MTEGTADRDRGAPEPAPADPVPSGREVVERALTATGHWQLQRRRGPDGAVHYEIICNGVFLMASYNQASDRALASEALARVSGGGLRVLVGGLGIGYTARAALDDPRVHRVDVVEVEPLVVAWHRAHFAPLCGHPLDDPRAVLVQADLADLPLPPAAYHAILLDTDNGPGWLVRDTNARLYDGAGVRRLAEALRPGGVLACWSAQRAPAFVALLQAWGTAEEVEVADQVGPGRPTSAWISLVRLPPDAGAPPRWRTPEA